MNDFFEFNLKTNVKFGSGQAINLAEYLKELSFNRIGIVVDSAVFDFQYIKKILKKLNTKEFSFIKIWKYNLKKEPDYDSLDKVKIIFLNKKLNPLVDCFVGIGGGSVIDFTKGLATLTVNKGKAIEYRGFPEKIKPCLPVIALPTVAGTGSEVTFNAVFIDQKEKKKLGINTRYNFPVLTILDPSLTLTCPKNVSLSSGVDILVHVLEGYGSKNNNPLVKVFAKQGFKLAFNNLAKVLENPKNIDFRTNLQLASYFGGLTLLGSAGGPTGALSYSLGVHFNVPHGLAGGIFLPYIIKHNINKGYDYSELYDLINGVDKNIIKKQKNKLFVKKMFDFFHKIEAPLSLKDFKVNQNNVVILLKEVENYEKAFAQNPVSFSVEDSKKLLLKLIK